MNETCTVLKMNNYIKEKLKKDILLKYISNITYC